MNKHLLNAARYLNAIHDIAIDENHPKLEALVRKCVLQIESKTLNNYWKAYLKDTDIKIESTVEIEYQSEKVQEDNVFYYRGVERSVKTVKDNLGSNNTGLVYRGAIAR